MGKGMRTQQKIYDYILEYRHKNGITPTVREICAAVGLHSTSAVHAHLKSLEQQGRIARTPSKQRSIVVSEQPMDDNREKDFPINVPLVGNVAAGQPILAIENIEESFPLPPMFMRGAEQGEIFMLHVEGESMIDAGIMPGDILIVRKDLSIQSGDIVVARVRRENATVKRFFDEDGRVRLQPENSSMDPIYVQYADLEIDGKIIGLLRSY